MWGRCARGARVCAEPVRGEGSRRFEPEPGVSQSVWPPPAGVRGSMGGSGTRSDGLDGGRAGLVCCRRLKPHGLAWADALPVLETVDSLEAIEDAIADPAGFLAKVAEAGGAVGMKLALAKARPALEPKSGRAVANRGFSPLKLP